MGFCLQCLRCSYARDVHCRVLATRRVIPLGREAVNTSCLPHRQPRSHRQTTLGRAAGGTYVRPRDIQPPVENAVDNYVEEDRLTGASLRLLSGNPARAT